MLTRSLYTLLWYLALPLTPLRLWWRGRREPGYLAHRGERYGRYAEDSAPAAGEVLWVHAVSLGETRAAAPLIERLRRERPGATILLTAMTATGREAGRAFAGGGVVQAWLPYDVPFAVNAFLERFRPRAGFLIETELWPNLIAAARRRGVALFLVNARMSERSAGRYARVPGLVAPMLAALAGTAAQTAQDAERLARLGARDVVVTGNLKFDLPAAPEALALGAQLRERFGRDRPVWLAASTRDGEEALILDAIARGALPAGTLTVVVPRHPQRFAEVAALLERRGLAFARRSQGASVPRDVAFLLGDSMGELAAYYAAADVAFVGGSLLPFGGQNLIEPIALRIPTLFGEHTFNFADAAAQAVASGAARRVADADELVAAVAALLADPVERAAMGARARAFHAGHAGAADRLWAWLAPRLPPPTQR